MFEDLKGKKLLVLGCTQDDCQIIEAAKELGVYTIVTDNHENWDEAPAKLIADEAWNISWADIDALKSRAIKEGVNGVMAGYSEFRTYNAMLLSHELGTSFYIENNNQLQLTRDKKLFKDVCRKCNIPVANEYQIDLSRFEKCCEQIVFPVIVKPTDNGGSRGITICYDAKQLREGIDYALSFSASKQYIVEEFIQGHEVTSYFTVADGHAVCSSIFDKYARIGKDGVNTLPDAYFYPSSCSDYFLKNHCGDVIRMIEGIGIRNGVISLQSFMRDGGGMAIFEMGFRLGGTSSFHYTKYFNNVSHMDMLISYSLTGNMHPELLENEDPSYKGNKACTFTLLSTPGIITKQDGDCLVKALPNVLHTCFYHNLGTIIEDNNSQFPKTYRAYIVGKDIKEIRETIKSIQSLIKVEDENGKNMLYTPFNVNLLDTYKKY